jgi:hypothetical protein
MASNGDFAYYSRLYLFGATENLPNRREAAYHSPPNRPMRASRPNRDRDFVGPNNSDSHRSWREEVRANETYDYLVLGGSPSGCVVAHELLTRDSDCTVCIVEAGSANPSIRLNQELQDAEIAEPRRG